ncbi:VOC family protein [Fusibacter sp. 3D3]|uniref:VOC family protein n=1 Tax=Fusibacter sp. 3D3 TaxID=1048380 RepID=UPI0008537ED0|nr:VOC family protein [Fusibacter sp. 3D3]GAU76743.1 glyoxalase family protein [Fusibacter sp. 3D3]
MYKSGLTVWYSVKDIEVTKAFYSNKLGFELYFDDKDGGNVIMSTNTADCTIGFSVADEVVPSTSSLVFEVENIEKAYETLKSRGVEFIGRIETVPGMTKLATFVDPDENILMLSETLVEDLWIMKKRRV